MAAEHPEYDIIFAGGEFLSDFLANGIANDCPQVAPLRV